MIRRFHTLRALAALAVGGSFLFGILANESRAGRSFGVRRGPRHLPVAHRNRRCRTRRDGHADQYVRRVLCRCNLVCSSGPKLTAKMSTHRARI